jgi:hypothetical protein
VTYSGWEQSYNKSSWLYYFFNMVISDIKASYTHKTQGKKHRKNLLLFVNVIQKFWKVVQMREPPYIQVGHRTQLSKSVLSCQNQGVWDHCQKCIFDLEKTGTFGIPNQICRDTRTEICKIHKTGIVPGKFGWMGSLYMVL